MKQKPEQKPATRCAHGHSYTTTTANNYRVCRVCSHAQYLINGAWKNIRKAHTRKEQMQARPVSLWGDTLPVVQEPPTRHFWQ